MHQVTLEQLSTRIPRCVSEWSCEDVCTWLTLNQIQFDPAKIRHSNVDGARAKIMTPTDWINGFNFSKFIAKQIVQWLDEDADEFDTLAQETLAQQAHQSINQTHPFHVEQTDQDVEASQLKLNMQQQKQRSYGSGQGNLLGAYNMRLGQPKLKSSPLLSQSKYQFEQPEPQGHSDQESRSDNQSQQLSSFESKSEDEDRDQIISLKSEEKQSRSYKIGQLEMRKINSEVTERVDKKLSNFEKPKKFSLQPVDRTKLKQVDALEDQIIKNKKDEVKPLNDKSKNRNKEISKNPKLYSYINANYSSNQNIVSSKGALKKVTSVQQIQCVKKMDWPQNENQKKAKRPVLPTPPNLNLNGLQNPHVKFVSSELVSYFGQNVGRPMRYYEKMLKVAYPPNFEKTIMGYSKIGRAAGSDIVLTEQSVSRTHAEVIPHMKLNGETSFMLKDLGSRFGTYVQCRGVQEGIQGKSYFIGDSEIEILSIEPSKNTTNLYKKPTFDLKIKIDKEKEITLINRSTVNIGKRLSSDIKLENSCESARIWMEKDKKFCMEGVEGKIYLKLKQHEQWDIQTHLDSNKKVQIVFGWLKVNFQLIETCVICNNKSSNCSCPSEQESWRKNRPN